MNDGIAIGLISTLFFGTILAIVFGFFAYRRYLAYRETIFLAERGLLKPAENGAGKSSLRWGVALTGLGIAFCLGLFPIGWLMPGKFPLNFGPWMLFGLIPTFFGLALVLTYYLTNPKSEPEKKLEAGPLPIAEEAIKKDK